MQTQKKATTSGKQSPIQTRDYGEVSASRGGVGTSPVMGTIESRASLN